METSMHEALAFEPLLLPLCIMRALV
jgi:hypothetical protein